MKKLILIIVLTTLYNVTFAQSLIEGLNINSKTNLVEFSNKTESVKSFDELSHLAFNWAIGYKSENNLKKLKKDLRMQKLFTGKIMMVL